MSKINTDVTVTHSFTDQEKQVIDGMDRDVSRYQPIGPCAIDDFDKWRRHWDKTSLKNLNFLLGKMLERYDQHGRIDDYHRDDYDVDVVRSMFDTTETLIANIERMEQHTDKVEYDPTLEL